MARFRLELGLICAELDFNPNPDQILREKTKYVAKKLSYLQFMFQMLDIWISYTTVIDSHSILFLKYFKSHLCTII